MSSITADVVYVADLVSEAERYLATVDYFRSQGCEPEWRSEATHPQTALLDTASPAPSVSVEQVVGPDRG